jgi:integrase-like protein
VAQLPWLLSRKPGHLTNQIRALRDPEGIGRLDTLVATDPCNGNALRDDVRPRTSDLADVVGLMLGTGAQNVRRQWRQARTDTGLEWVKPHTFRKTVATLIDKEADTAAAQLGHTNKEITRKHYIDKPALAPDSSAILDQLGQRVDTPSRTSRSRETPSRIDPHQRQARGVGMPNLIVGTRFRAGIRGRFKTRRDQQEGSDQHLCWSGPSSLSRLTESNSRPTLTERRDLGLVTDHQNLALTCTNVGTRSSPLITTGQRFAGFRGIPAAAHRRAGAYSPARAAVEVRGLQRAWLVMGGRVRPGITRRGLAQPLPTAVA